jgi:hypothetical protein
MALRTIKQLKVRWEGGYAYPDMDGCSLEELLSFRDDPDLDWDLIDEVECRILSKVQSAQRVARAFGR